MLLGEQTRVLPQDSFDLGGPDQLLIESEISGLFILLCANLFLTVSSVFRSFIR